MERTTPHVVLLGDSVFDSRAYLPGAPHMAERLSRMVGDLRTTLCAVSGSRLGDVARQAARIPGDATHLVVSIGGNDLLDLGSRLRHAPGGWLERLRSVEPIMTEFRGRYAEACATLANRELSTAMCSIYEPPVADPMLRMAATAISGAVNDIVSDEARRRDFDVVDLRPVCRAAADFHDPIHPSAAGADKIARALADWVESQTHLRQSHDSAGQSRRPTASPNLRASEAAAKK